MTKTKAAKRAIICPAVGKIPQNLTLFTLAKGTPLFRVVGKDHTTVAWDKRQDANYRFSSIVNSAGAVIPVCYTATSLEAALLETVLRHTLGVPAAVIPGAMLQDRFMMELETTRALHLIDLAGPAAQPFGLGVAPAIAHAYPSQYPATRAWALALFQAYPGSDGVRWVSAQHNGAPNIMLWTPPKTRIAKPPLMRLRKPLSLLADAHLATILALAQKTGHSVAL